MLPYRPPYDWASMLRFLGLRAIGGLEFVTDDSYSRVIQIGEATGSVTVSHALAQSALRVIVRFPRLDALSAIIARLRRMFDLSTEPRAIAAALSVDPMLAPLVSAREGLRLPGGWDGFEIAVRAILGQQISVKGATTLAKRIISTLGDRLDENTNLPALTHAFPRPEFFDLTKLLRVGLTKSRAAALANVAAAAVADPRLFDPRRDLDQAVSRLRTLPGVGEWTAQYIAMRALGESDAFLAADVGIQRQMARNGQRPTAAQALAHAERWRPWRAYAMLHLWMAESENLNLPPMKEIAHALAT